MQIKSTGPLFQMETVPSASLFLFIGKTTKLPAEAA